MLQLPQLFHKKIGIDLGTSRVRIWVEPQGVVVDEPTAIALDTQVGKVVAVGLAAEEMAGRVGAHVQVTRPLAGGRVADADLAQAMLKVFLQRVFRNVSFFRPSMMVSVPSQLPGIQKEILSDMLYALGAREVLFVDQVLAAAIGAGVPIADASGSFVLQLGAGLCEGGIISLGSLVVSRSSEYAGNFVDEAVQRVVRQEAQVHIGLRVAEEIKKKVLTFLPERNKRMTVTGQDVIDGVPKEVVLETSIFVPLMAQLLERYVVMARQLFEHIPPELTNDVIDKGMIVSGGLAQIEGVEVALLAALGVPVSAVEEPDRATIKGIGQILQNLALFKASIGYQQATGTYT